jgi:hypothetical protein
MKRIHFCFLVSVIVSTAVIAQNAPNLSNAATLTPGTEKASKLSSVPVNIFTGVPQVGVPLYSYANPNNGLSLSLSLDYFAGGTQVAESPTTVGLGWYLNTGGSINRTVRGAPDDFPGTGFMYASAIPSDYRSNGDKYYYDSLDAQQDIFQFNFNGRSGKFFIGKNGQIVVVPSSKIKITPVIGTGSSASQIVSFRIVTEDGNKYEFSGVESSYFSTPSDTTLFRSAYYGHTYNSAWYLTQVIAAFSADTIKLNYSNTSNSYSFALPQVTFVRNSDGVRTKTYSPTGGNNSNTVQISAIVFPDKTNVSFLYSSGNLVKVKIGDTAFRFGYLLDYQTTFSGNPTRLLLKSVTPYTVKEKKNGYNFLYYTPMFAPLGSGNDTIQNKRDYWGYYNGANNGTNLIPQVNGYSWGADRNPNGSYAVANALRFFNLPGGGYILYEYELNTHYPYIKSPQKLTVTPTTTSASAASFNQVFNNLRQLRIVLDSTVSRQGAGPISGTGSWTLNITDDNLNVYATTTISLYELFYQGIKTWSFNLPDGNYYLRAIASSGTTITGSFPVNIQWENRTRDNSSLFQNAGGIRVWRVTRQSAVDDPTGVVQQFRYTNTDGTSSGFLGDIPKYDYPYLETVNNGGSTTTSYTAVSSEPVSTMNYAQGSPVGYSRVEVIEGTTTHNNGKTVYEFTSFKDVNSNFSTATFPYTNQDIRDWGLGAPKTVSVYDSTGRLVKKTVSNYGLDTSFFVNSNFRSIKLGNSYTVVNGDPNSSWTPRVRTHIAQEYYPSSGRIYLASSVDSLFQGDNSVNTSSTTYVYDTNYNVSKIITSYDRNRGLQLEKRIYYPYNYTIGGAIGKLRDSGILNTVVSTETWVTGDANPRIVSGSITDYQQLSAGYIKPQTIYALQSNKPITESVIGTFNPATLNRNAGYFVAQTSFPNYDSKANPLQVQSLISGLNNSVIMDYGQTYTIAKVSNAVVSDIAYTSFESDGSGNWTIGSALRDSSGALSGRKSYNLGNGNVSKSSLNSAKTYLVSLWAKTGASISVNGSSLTSPLASQLGWNLFQATVNGVTSVTISGSGLIDELRLHPVEANMVTSTYEPMIGVTTSIDANNTVVYSEYDNLNRIKLIRDKDKNILKRYDYSDTAMVINTAPIWSCSKLCRNGYDGIWDSTCTDINPLSDSYQVVRGIASGTNYCTCAAPEAHPDYKIVNGVCEQAVRCNTSCTHVKINQPDGTQIWKYRCIWHYQWSDSSVGADVTEYNDYACPLGCGGGIDP